MSATWHVIHKPTAKTLCGQPNDGAKPAEGEPCNGCATAMYDVFGEVLDELEATRATVARVEALADTQGEDSYVIVHALRAALTRGASDGQ
ncbi:hypothetical protein [Ornithinimicrobium sufpigmenti]|uniref:hypothetical protein n=1 Tax=Ornithinimicrobium sufpigmenti TaxID=2508882 RepID=UPI001035ED63|nr:MULTISPECIES: hypothetical protein [unclassified Ornithinimicrobium]